MSKTIRVIYPDWMGGANKNYAFGCKLLSMLMPQTDKTEILEIPVNKDFDKELIVEDMITEKSTLLKQQKTAKEMIATKAPEKIITIGGPCSAEQASINYLHGLYPDAGLIWIDVHPDITKPGDYENEHAMVLGNLMGEGSPDFAALVDNPFNFEDVMYVGLKEDEMEIYEKAYMAEYKIRVAGPALLKEQGSKPVADWIRERGFKRIIVHFDLDVMDPVAFRSLLVNEPLVPTPPFVKGAMNLPEITDVLLTIQKEAEIVGLGICEYMPWDAIALRRTMEQLTIFND